MLNENLGYHKKVELAIVQEKEDLEKLIQAKNIVQQEERGKKRGRQESMAFGTSG